MLWKKILKYLKRNSKVKAQSPIGPCGISKSVIPQEFLDKFPVWDSHICGKTKIIV